MLQYNAYTYVAALPSGNPRPVLTYLCPSIRWDHGPSIKALHRILRCARVTLFCQVYSIVLTSDSTSRRQVILGRPLFLFPWGFHVRACLVMLDVGFLSVWPIQRHFRFIYFSTGSWLVVVNKVLLLNLSDHITFMILRRHLFTNVCILFTVCLLNSPWFGAIYNITDLTL